MSFYFSPEFISQFKKILKSNADKNLEKIFIDGVLSETSENIISIGTSKINSSAENSLIKKRLKKDGKGKSSSYRTYFYFRLENDVFEFIYIYPKTGRRSQSSVKKQQLKDLLKQFSEDKQNDNLTEVCLNKKKTKIIDKNTKKEIF
ncbi:MAG: type II toxin-antitoxin system RelE/ParE family toxin [Bacteroidales bacterium]|nr:type II toxin-antitoxin system RelE/ParE family toxin [Bacteroidales bacterium]